ncbi:MAG: flippase-like domain-containing protein, partial [Gemmatimonadota bacterium]|nr:flippase-like domain-containing protein [Gemmatimonadota bacterium]
MRLRMSWRAVRRTFGLVLTGVVFAVLFRFLSAEDLAAAVRRIDPAWILPLLVLVALGELTRALKWRLILAPIRSVGVVRLYGAIMIGYLSNLIIPLRVSPLVRAYVIRAKEGIPTSTVLATVAVDRLADGLVSVGLL